MEQQQQQQQQGVAAAETEEAAWLRECLFALQGVSGERIQFVVVENDGEDEDGDNTTKRVRPLHPPHHYKYYKSKSKHQQYQIPPNLLRSAQRLSAGARDAIFLCAEVGWLFRQIQSYILESTTATFSSDSSSSSSSRSAVQRALAQALARELQDHRLRSSLLAAAATNLGSGISPQHQLRALSARARHFQRHLKRLAALCDDGCGCGGGGDPPATAADILTHLHRHARHGGGAEHAPAVQSLLAAAARPWFQSIFQWTVDGRWLLHERAFLVVRQFNNSNNKNSESESESKYLWHEGYALDRTQIPKGVLPEDLAEAVFIVGKGVNYIRRCLDDAEWSLRAQLVSSSSILAEEDNDADLCVKLGFSYAAPSVRRQQQQQQQQQQHSGHFQTLRSTLEAAAVLVNSHILQSLRQDYHLIDHLFALKQFLLLGQGDFVSTVMDGLHAEYHQHTGIHGIYRHNLASIVEHALQSTNACVRFSHSILERLQVELILDPDDPARHMFAPPRRTASAAAAASQQQPDHRTVWDIFTLEYTIPDPLFAIVHPQAMASYQRLFRFLFRLKKVEFLLDYTWRQSSILQRALHSNAQHLVIYTSTNAAYARAVILLRQVAMARQSMMHFVGNVKSYLMFEVLEGGWERLVPALERASSLDQVIQAHDQYLHEILRKSLLVQEEDVVATATEIESLDLGGTLESLLALADDFCTYQKELFGEALDAADRAAEKRREAEYLAKHGSWGFSREQEAAEQETCFGLSDTSKLDELDRLTEQFNHQIYSFLKALDSKLNGSPAWEDDVAVTPSTPSPFKAVTADGATHTAFFDGGCAFDGNDDLDSLRFLASQLDHNKYYGVANF